MSYEGPLEWRQSHELRGFTGVRVMSYEGSLESESLVMRVHWRVIS